MQDKKEYFFAARCSGEEHQFLSTALKWFRAQTSLLQIGSISMIPNVFKNTETPAQTSEKPVIMPKFVEEILNGGAYPNREDCTQQEAKVLYDKEFQNFFSQYIQCRNELEKQGLYETIAAYANVLIQEEIAQ